MELAPGGVPAMALLRGVEMGNSVIRIIGMRTIESVVLSIVVVRHAMLIGTPIGLPALSSLSASLVKDERAVSRVLAGKIVPQHSVLMPPVHDTVSSLRVTTSISKRIPPIAQNMLRDAGHVTKKGNAMRLQSVM
jgi:hypothetical protein